MACQENRPTLYTGFNPPPKLPDVIKEIIKAGYERTSVVIITRIGGREYSHIKKIENLFAFCWR